YIGEFAMDSAPGVFRRCMGWLRRRLKNQGPASRMLAAVTLATGLSAGTYLHAFTDPSVVDPQNRSGWETKHYRISDDDRTVYPLGKTKPPKGWEPDLSQ